jgi:hypothetical protein
VIAPQELLELKQRILLGADVANHLANSDGEFLELEPDQYAVVHAALEGLKDDCGRVLAELDILRGMFADKVGAFFMEVASAGVQHGRDGGATVAGVPDEAPAGCSEEPRSDVAEASGGVHRGRPDRKPRKRSQPRRNRKDDGGDQSELDASTGTRPLDSGASA